MALGDNRALISCGLVTNDGHFLTGLPLPTDHRSYIHCSFLTDTECPDPCLELFFQCRAYRDYQGYRNLHRTHARFTSTDVAELRIIRLEAPNNEVSLIYSILSCRS